MRVLMFGWEFPPFQAGGLATATLGLVKGLLGRGIEVTLVVPFAAAGSDVPGLRLVSAAEPRPGLRSIRIESPLQPYAGAEEYLVLSERRRGTTGGPVYGSNLFDEVERYGEVAALIAAEEPHDLIDTHDWITFAAGARARAVSGKPLVAHIHATEYDRCGGPGNPEIHRRERAGMLAADRVISNSAILRRRVMEHYDIPGEKIDVVHFGIDLWTEQNAAEELPVAAERPTVLFLGRVTRQKGPEYFIEVARRVADHVPARSVHPGRHRRYAPSSDRARGRARPGRPGAFRRAGAGGRRGPALPRVRRLRHALGERAAGAGRPGEPPERDALRHPQGVGSRGGGAHAFRVDFWDVEETANKVVGLLTHPTLWEELSEAGLEEVRSPRLGSTRRRGRRGLVRADVVRGW